VPDAKPVGLNPTRILFEPTVVSNVKQEVANDGKGRMLPRSVHALLIIVYNKTPFEFTEPPK